MTTLAGTWDWIGPDLVAEVLVTAVAAVLLGIFNAVRKVLNSDNNPRLPNSWCIEPVPSHIGLTGVKPEEKKRLRHRSRA